MNALWEQVNSSIPEILHKYTKIAVIGLSPKSWRPSHSVAAYMKEVGYTIYPVNPGHEKILGQKCYHSLSEIPEPIEIVDIFRRSELVLPIVQEAISI